MAALEEYDYDHKFRRTLRRVCSGSGPTCSETSCTRFVYDTSDRLIGEYECGTAAPIAEYVYVEGYRVLAVRRDGAWYWYLSDHLPTPQKVLDASGVVVWDGRMEPFGTTDEVVADVEQPLRFPGQYAAPELMEIVHGKLRSYMPRLGRWSQAEPSPIGSAVPAFLAAEAPSWLLGLPAAQPLEAFGFCQQRPVTLRDPEGGIPEFPYPPPAGTWYPPAPDACDAAWWTSYLSCAWTYRLPLLWGGFECASLCRAAVIEAGQGGAAACLICTVLYKATTQLLDMLSECRDDADNAEASCRHSCPGEP